MTKPISPDEVQSKKDTSIPAEVFQAFNELIVKHWNGSSARVLLKDAAALARTYLGKDRSDKLFEYGWMDVESAYEKEGWVVKFDKPVYYGGEDFDAYYLFSKKRMR